jgi:hypothetical protein
MNMTRHLKDEKLTKMKALLLKNGFMKEGEQCIIFIINDEKCHMFLDVSDTGELTTPIRLLAEELEWMIGGWLDAELAKDPRNKRRK